MSAEPTGLLGAQRAVFRSSLGPMEKLVMLAALDHWGSHSQRPWPSIERLAAHTSLSRTTVLRAIRGLETKGALTVQRARGCSNVYTLAAAFAGSLPVAESNQSPRVTSRRGRLLPVPASDVHQSRRATSSSRAERPEGSQGRNPMKGAREGTAASPSQPTPPPGIDARSERTHFTELRHAIRVGYEQRYLAALAAPPGSSSKASEQLDKLTQWIATTSQLRRTTPERLLAELLHGFFSDRRAAEKRFPLGFLAHDPGSYLPAPNSTVAGASTGFGPERQALEDRLQAARAAGDMAAEDQARKEVREWLDRRDRLANGRTEVRSGA